MARATIGAGGSAVTLYTQVGSVNVAAPLGQAATASFNIVDPSGQYHFYKGQPVTITSSIDTSDVWFVGVIDQRKETKYGFYPGRLHALTCVDNTYFAQKRVIGAAYVDILAGDIVSDMVDSVLSQEGIMGQHVIQTTTTLSDFGTGTLTNVAAYSDGSDGHLEILHGGSAVSKSYSSQTDWQTGTVTGGMSTATAGHIELASHPVIAVTATSTGSAGGNWYQPIGGTVSQSVASGDYLEYYVYVPTSSVVIRGGVDNTNNGTSGDLKGLGILDQNGYEAHPHADLTGKADGLWYYRKISLTSLAGKTITQWSVAMDNITATGSLVVYFRDIYVRDNTNAIKYTVFDSTVSGSESYGTATTSAVSSVSASSSTGYDDGVWESASIDLSNASIVSSSSISWTVNSLPTNTVITTETSINTGKTWETATSGSAIPGLLTNQKTGVSLLIRFTFSTGGDPTNGTPDITALSVSVSTSSSAVKTDWNKDESTTSTFSGGTLTDVIAANNSVVLDSYIMSSWATGTTDSQTQWASGTSPATAVQDGRLLLQVTGAGDIKSQMGGVTNIADFYATLSGTVTDGSTSGTIGLIYRTTAWSNQKDGYAYYFSVSSTGWEFGHGTNSTGSSAFTSLHTGALSLTDNDIVRIDVEVSGSSHTFYVNGTQYGPYTDSTYTAAGGFAIRYNNISASQHTPQFTQFGVIYADTLSGNRVSPGLAPPPVQVDSSYVNWEATVPSEATLTVDFSTDGGSTWHTNISAEAALPGLTQGTSLVGMSLCWRFNLSTTNPAVTPAVTGFTARIASTYYAGGLREHPTLDLSQAGIAGSAPVVYTTTLPSGTAVRIDSTLQAADAGTSLAAWTTSGSMSIDSAFGQGDSSSYAFGNASSYMNKQQALKDLEVYDFDFNIDAGSVAKMLNFHFMCDASGNGQVFHFSASSGVVSGFATCTAWNTVGTVSGASLYYEIATATWYHATFVFAGGTVSAYINGQFAGSYSYVNTGNYLGFSILTTTSNTYTGHVDNLRLWNTQNGTAQNVPGINYADGGYLDTFDFDSSSLYSLTHESSGSDAAWTWDVANSRLTAVGGNYAQAIYTTALQTTDVVLISDVYRSDAGGLIARYSDSSNYYELLLADNSSTNAATTLRIYKWVAGTRSLVAESGQLAWTRNTLHRISWSLAGNNHSVSFDGAVALTTSDSSILVDGSVGFSNNTVTSGSTAYFYNFSIAPTGESTIGVSVTLRDHLTSTDASNTPELLDVTVSARSWYIQDGPTILQAVFTYPYVSDAINELATKSNFFWLIDKNKQLWFMPRTASLAPWIADGTTMMLETIEIDHGNPLYRNQQLIRSVTDTTDPQVETQKGDGSKQAFTMGYPLNAVPVVKVNGVTQTVGIKGVDTGKQWYWSQGNEVITQDSTGTPLASSDSLEVDYIGQFDAVIISNDQTAIADRQAVEGSGSGIVEAVVDEPSDTSSDIAQQSASQLLATYAVIGTTVKFTTRIAGLVAGQVLTVNLPEHDINYQDFLIENADPTEGPGGVTYWNVSAIEGPVTGDWVAALQRFAAKAPVTIDQINVGTNEVLTTSIPVSESWPWSETVTPTVNTGSAPDTTLYPSTTLYPL